MTSFTTMIKPKEIQWCNRARIRFKNSSYLSQLYNSQRGRLARWRQRQTGSVRIRYTAIDTVLLYRIPSFYHTSVCSQQSITVYTALLPYPLHLPYLNVLTVLPLAEDVPFIPNPLAVLAFRVLAVAFLTRSCNRSITVLLPCRLPYPLLLGCSYASNLPSPLGEEEDGRHYEVCLSRCIH